MLCSITEANKGFCFYKRLHSLFFMKQMSGEVHRGAIKFFFFDKYVHFFL